MKTQATNRVVSLLLALFMLLTCVPLTFMATNTAARAEGATKVLEAKDLAAFDAGAKADGDSITAGTDGFFKVFFSAKSKVDSSSKSFNDGYESGQRINFGGKAEVGKNSVGFTTSGAATVKIWWVQQGDTDRHMAILDGSGNAVAQSDATAKKNDPEPVTTLKIANAGTYYLGGFENGNYIFKVEVTEESAAAQEYELEAKNLTAFAAGDKADGASESAGTDNFFKIFYSSKSKVDSSGKTFNDGYESGQRINFGGKAEVGKNSIGFTTTGEATVKIWWVQAGDTDRHMAILDSNGNTVAQSDATAKKNDPEPVTTLKLANAGTYYLGGLENNNYIFKVSVSTGGGAVVRGDWSAVATPKLVAITQKTDANGKETNQLVVTVEAVVGKDGGDMITVYMCDADGNVLESRNSVGEKSSHDLTFTPKASGDYFFMPSLSRDGESVEKDGEIVGIHFTLPLGIPNISSVTNNGGGKVNVKWGPVDEATGYIIYAAGKEIKTSTNSGTVEGLKVGDKVDFTVAAVRGSETGEKSAPVTALITDVKQVEWGFIAQGTSATNGDKNKYEGNLNEGSVTIYGNGGKFNRAADDGYSFYYTVVPSNMNFTFRAKIHVDTWTYDNGQEGFGVAAVDAIAEKMFDSSHWSNFYMALVTRVESPFNARLGVTTHSKTGITPDNWTAVKDAAPGARDPIYGPEEPLDYTGRDKGFEGKFNIVGNCANPDKLEQAGYTSIDSLTDFDLEITKNNTGFYTTYYKNGKVVETIKHWGTDELSKLDKDNIYVGFVAARGATITVKADDYTLDIHDPSKDPAPEEKPLEYVTPSISIESSANANSTDYNLILKPNYKGTATVTVNGTVVKKDLVVGDQLDSDGNVMETILPVTIKSGNNTISVAYKVDPSVKLGEGYAFSKTDASASLTVNYNTYFAEQNNLYVSPKGNKNGNGGKEYPLDLQTALNVARPGQRIILMEGTYSASAATFRAPRSVSGTKDAYIYLVVDPDAKTRPVIDAEGNSGIGLDIVGDYWYLQGFDIAHAGSNGLRIAGNYCVADLLQAYENYSTGIAIQGDSKYSRLLWPSNNLVKNCEAYYNCDPGLANADGFSAKLIVGKNNVFDNCVSHHNSDDGWDLYGRNVVIEPVTIQNCVSYANGYLKNGTAGTGGGNGFKLGGDNNGAAHLLINSVAFNNLANGITCNSSPNIIVKNCTSYNNGSGGIALYTKASQTDFESVGVISYKNGAADNFEPQGSQDITKVSQTYWDGKNGVADDWFENLTFKGSVARNADGSINMEGFLVLTNKAPKDAGARISAVKSDDVQVVEDENLPNPTTGVDYGFMVAIIALAGAAVLALFIKKRRA